MNKKLVFGVVIFLVLVGAGAAYFKFGTAKEPAAVGVTDNERVEAATNAEPASDPTSVPSSTASAIAGNVKEFIINGSNYAFDPKQIKVKKGDTVKITFKDDDGSHNLVIDGYNVQTNVIGPGSDDTITFVADKTGSFEYFCSVGQHADLGMTGTLIVE